MKLLDEIVDLAVEGETSLPVLLRKCLVLSHRLKNERLKVWAEKELDGYTNDDALPDYRVTNTNSKGIFFGAFGSKIENQPIPTLVLKEHHRALVEIAHLRSPIASYQLGTKGNEGQWSIPWSPNLVAIYQAKFYEGAYALVSAWQELPTTFIAALLDTVRNRVLKLGLELQEELGSVGDNPAALSPERIDQTVITNIYGGHVVIAARVRDVTSSRISCRDRRGHCLAQGDAGGTRNDQEGCAGFGGRPRRGSSLKSRTRCGCGGVHSIAGYRPKNNRMDTERSHQVGEQGRRRCA